MDGRNPDYEAECERYATLLKQHPLDISCLGIGENGHLAYNEPGTADFNDPKLVKVIEMVEASRIQAIHDGTFPKMEDVPQKALTITVPPMINAGYIFAVAPGPNKTEAINKTVNDEISTACPSTILRNFDCILYTDTDGGAKI
jgi:glucosamine-6-phosphate deaminase